MLNDIEHFFMCFLAIYLLWRNVCKNPSFLPPWTVAHQSPMFMEFPGKNIAVGSHSLLQGIFPTQGLNPGLLHCRQIHYYLSHQGSPSPFINCMVFKKYLSNNSFTFWIDYYQISDLQVFFPILCVAFLKIIYMTL